MGGLILHGLVPSGAGRPPGALPHLRIEAGPLTGLATATSARPVLDDPETTLEMAGTHNALLVAYAAVGDVLPVRLGACFSGETALVTHLARDPQPLLATLARLSGQAEYALRLDTADDAEPDDHPPATGGRAYLAAKRSRHAARRSRSETRRELSRTIRRTAEDIARASLYIPGNHPARLLDLALLMPKLAIGDLVGRLEALAEEAAHHGLLLRLTGPCPPYSFTHPIEELADA